MKELFEKMKKNLRIHALEEIANDLAIELGGMDQRWESLSEDERDYMNRILAQLSRIQEMIKRLKNPLS